MHSPPWPTQDFRNAQNKIKTMLEMMLEKNDRAICLKCFLEVNVFPFLQNTQKGKCKKPYVMKGVLAPTSSGLGRGTVQNC